MSDVSEAQRAVVEADLKTRFPCIEGNGGCSPYAGETIVFVAPGAEVRGARINFLAVCQSHNGAGHYKERGRWRTVFLMAPAPDGMAARCDAHDTGATQLGFSGVYTRDWTLQEVESSGKGAGATALADALAALGL